MKIKHIPTRTCIVTREKRSKRELIKIIRNPETKKLEVDLRNKIKTRGANLTPSMEVFDKMVEKNLLTRALKLESKPTKEEYEILREDFQKAIEEKNFRPDNKPVKIRVDKKDLEKE